MWFVIGLFIGVVGGVVVTAICYAAKHGDMGELDIGGWQPEQPTERPSGEPPPPPPLPPKQE